MTPPNDTPTPAVKRLGYGFREGHPPNAVIFFADAPHLEVCQFFHDPADPDKMPELCKAMVEAYNDVAALEQRHREEVARLQEQLNTAHEVFAAESDKLKDLAQALKAKQGTDGVREILQMVDAWGNGLRHMTAHESKMVKAARAALSAAATEKGWLDIETAPKDGTAIWIGSTETGHYNVGSWMLVEGPTEEWCEHSEDPDFDSDNQPDVWQPLPAPPTPKETKLL